MEEELDPTGKRLARSILWVQMKSKTGSSKKEQVTGKHELGRTRAHQGKKTECAEKLLNFSEIQRSQLCQTDIQHSWRKKGLAVGQLNIGIAEGIRARRENSIEAIFQSLEFKTYLKQPDGIKAENAHHSLDARKNLEDPLTPSLDKSWNS